MNEHKCSILCRLGWHDWSDWVTAKKDDGTTYTLNTQWPGDALITGIIAIQSRTCKKCGKLESMRVNLI